MMGGDEPMSVWGGDNLTSVFLLNTVSDHKPRRLTGTVSANKEGTVMTVQTTELLPSVFQKLSVEGFMSAPVCVGSELVGQITLLDLVKHVNGLFYATTEDEWTEWFDKKLMFQTMPVSALCVDANEYHRCPYKTLNENTTSFSALELMGRSNHQQVLLTDSNKEANLNGILTQSMLISFLRQNKAKWGSDFTHIKVKDFEFSNEIKKPLQSIYEDELAINAFLKMEEADVHGLPILNRSGVLTGCISVRDLRGCGTDGSKFYRLYRTVRRFKELVSKEHEELAPSTHYSREHVPFGAVFVSPEDNMESVITKMRDGNLHRLFICSKESVARGQPQPIGVISQGDVLFNTLQHIIREQGGGRGLGAKATATSRLPAQRLTPRKVSPGKSPTAKSEEAKRPSPTKSPGAKVSPGKRNIQIM